MLFEDERAFPNGWASSLNAPPKLVDFFTIPRYIAGMKLRLIVEKDPETGRYSSVFPELPGCASAGDTEDLAIANAKEALELWFESTR
jgi:predicted RNase H-like HicB family nuclease